MSGSTRTLGIILTAAGVILSLAVAAWLIAGLTAGDLETGGALLGGIFGLLVVGFPLVGGGLFLFSRGKAEQLELQRSQRQRRLLGMVETAGEVSISDIAIELRSSRDEVRQDLIDLVSMGLFAGYVDWNTGTLYARQASELRSLDRCQNCGSELTLAGKGLVTCEFCGAEYFLP